MRRQFEYDQAGQFRTSTQFSQLSRATNRPNIPIDTSRRSTTPTKIQERISNSPLKTPLQNAISKAAKTNDFQRTSINMNKGLGRSSRRDESPIISMAKKVYYEEDPQSQQYRAHPQTANFIKKYFQTMNCEVPLQRFIQKIMQEFEALWGTQNAQKILDDFTYKIADIFNNDYIDLRELVRLTKQDGMIGLILRIFKQIKSQQNTRSSNYVSFTQNPQVVNISRSFEQRLIENQSTTGLKNVIQQFMQSMYQAMENQIYQKFNIQMRRMIVKYRQAEKLLKKVNEKINSYADVFDFDAKIKQKEKKYQAIIEQLTKSREKANSDAQKQRQISAVDKKQKQKLIQQITKLKETLQKYQNVVLTKAMQTSSPDISLLRQNSTQSRIAERPPLEPLRTSQISHPSQMAQPFKITIDTHVTHKENMASETKTITTTFHSPLNVAPPVQRESYESRAVNFRTSTSPFTSRITTYRPVSPSPVPLSPYQSRITTTRPL